MMPATGQNSTAALRPPPGETGPPVASAGPKGVFCALIDPILVPAPAARVFEGSVDIDSAGAIWTWLARDLAGDLLPGGAATQREAFETALPQIMTRLGALLAGLDAEGRRRLVVQLGGEAVHDRLPVVLHALRHRALLARAQAFGRAANAMPDEAGLVAALQSMPLSDRQTTALLLHAALGQVAAPAKLVLAGIRLAGGASETALTRAGLGPLAEGVLAHAQAQIAAMRMQGPFADIDRACRAIERFHRLVRALSAYVEMPRGGRWSPVLGALTAEASRRIEPRLKEVVSDINLAMRRRPDGTDRVDAEQMLAAFNGLYLLATLRECKDSLAINALFEQAWAQSGQALDIHLNRNLDLLKADPADRVADERLGGGIKMAELRFSPDYAETLTRARTAAQRR